MKIIQLFIIIVIVFLSVSCTRQSEVYTKLVHIDSLLSKNDNDSAKNILEQINEKKLTDKEKAYFYILKYAIYYRLEKDIYTDEDINYSIEYYTQTNDAQKLSNAYLYKALTHFYSVQKCEEVLLNLKKAESFAKKTKDYELANKIYSALSIYNLNEGLYNEALKFAKKEYYCAKRINNQRYEVYALLDLCVAYRELGMSDSANVFIIQCINRTKSINYKDNSFIYNAIGEYYLSEDNEIAEKYFLKALSYCDIPISYYNLANIYYKIKNYNKATDYCDSALSHDLGKFEIEVLDLKSKIKYDMGNIAEYTVYHNRINFLKDSILNAYKNNKSLEIQKKYDTSEHEGKYKKTLLLLCSILIVCLILFLVFMRRGKKLRKENSTLKKESSIMEKQTLKLLKVKTASDEQIKELQDSVEEQQKNESKNKDILSHGESVLSSMQNNEKKAWLPYDFECCISYFEFIHPNFAQKFKSGYKEKLTITDKIFIILEKFLSKSDEEICNILSVSINTVYSRRSKIKKKQI